MNADRESVGLRDWTRDLRVEPRVRVGVILESDARQTVHLQLPVDRYQSEGLGPRVKPLEPHAALEIKHAGDALAVRVGQAPAVTVGSLDLWCLGERSLEPGGGVLVREVVVGRGFHWQKHVDQTLAGQIRLLPGRRGVILVNELPLEDYLAGVITGEMSSACPLEFLKAQCVVARSWLLAMTEPKHADQPFERCNDDCCQRYQGTGDLTAGAIAAIRATRGCVLLNPTGDVLDTNYSKSCGGITETPWAVWGLDKPGIRPIVDAPPEAPERRFFPVTEANLAEYLDGAWLTTAQCYCGPNVVPIDALGRYLGRVDAMQDYFRWTVRYTRTELEELLRARLSDARELAELRDLRVRARGVSGRAYALEVEWTDTHGERVRRRVDSEYRIRYVLHRKFLYSAAFAIRAERDVDGRLAAITLRGAGWGHGVGMCQIGALGMTLAGLDVDTICHHYYPDSTLATVYA